VPLGCKNKAVGLGKNIQRQEMPMNTVFASVKQIIVVSTALHLNASKSLDNV
jgi:hypothetical protein